MHEKFLAVPLWRFGAFEQEETRLETPVRGSIPVNRRRRGQRGSRRTAFGRGHGLQFGPCFRSGFSCECKTGVGQFGLVDPVLLATAFEVVDVRRWPACNRL